MKQFLISITIILLTLNIFILYRVALFVLNNTKDLVFLYDESEKYLTYFIETKNFSFKKDSDNIIIVNKDSKSIKMPIDKFEGKDFVTQGDILIPKEHCIYLALELGYNEKKEGLNLEDFLIKARCTESL
jgi:hypothetical protein